MEQEESDLKCCSRVTVVTVKLRSLNSTDLPAPKFRKAFYNAGSVGDGNFRGDDRNAKRVTVDLRGVRRFVRGFQPSRVTTSLAEMERNLSRFCAGLSKAVYKANCRRITQIFQSKAEQIRGYDFDAG